MDQIRIKGDISYLPLLNGTRRRFEFDGFKINGQAVDLGVGPMRGSVTHPNQWISMSETAADALMANFPGASKFVPEGQRTTVSSNSQSNTFQDKFYFVPCNTTASLSVLAGGREYVIPAEKWLLPAINNASGCSLLSLVHAIPRDPTDQQAEARVAFGTPFLSSVYTSFRSNGAAAEIGFAQLSDAALVETAGSGRYASDSQMPPTEGGSAAKGEDTSDGSGTDNGAKAAPAGGTAGTSGTGGTSGGDASAQAATSGGGARRVSWLAMIGVLGAIAY